MSQFDLAVIGANVIIDGVSRPLSIGISGGRISALVDPRVSVGARETIRAFGMTVLPGLVDAHVHLREPGFAHKEGFEAGTRAAAAGGVTTVMVQPTTDPPTITADALREKVRLAMGKAYVDFALQVGVGDDPSHIAELAKMGAPSFELYLSDLRPPLLTSDSGRLLEVLYRIAEVGRVAAITPGDDGIVASYERNLAPHLVGTALGFVQSRPPIAEAMGTARACQAARETCARVHLRQISCRESVNVVRKAKEANIRLTAEVMPHHLVLTAEEVERQGPYAKMSPPLRGAEDVESLWEALHDGVIDIIATDHAPHLPTEKDAGIEDLRRAPGGIPGLQTLLPIMLDQVAKGRLSLAQLVGVCSEKPARIFGLYPRKGVIQVGADADLVLIDLTKEFEITNAQQYSRSGRTPFAGWKTNGTIERVMVRGNTVYKNSRIIGSPIGRQVIP